jgi:DNA repair exonuclease SbcCD ATPase subunit
MKALLGIAFIFPTLALRQTDDNPVTRVVGLLEQLKSRIESDGKTEQAAYDKYACWCEKSTQKTAATITDIKDLLKLTGSTILKLKGSVATLSSEIKGLVQDIKENEDKQAEQTSIREKENAAFMAEKAELESAIGALEKAIQVLKAATSASFVQTTAWKSTVSEAIAKMSEVSNVRLNEKQLSLISQLSDHQETYAPQSATIQGILSDMYTTFSKNLQTSTADEAKAHRNYEELMAVFQKQLKTLQETLVKKEQRKAEHEIQLADATQTYADSEEQLKAEIKLFDTTKSACEEKTTAWSERSALRATELEGITKALDILTSDDAKKLFAKSIKPGFSKGAKASFVQVSSHTVSGVKVQKAFKVLEARAQQVHSFRLAALAAEVRTQAATSGMFDAVMKTIDELMAQLDEEEQADIKKVDECKEQYQDITSNKNDLDWKIENNKAKIQTHEKEIEQKTETKEVTIKDIESADKQLKEMKSERKEENDAYVEAKSDDEKAIGLLKKS